MARCNEIIGRWQDAVQEYESNAQLHKDPGSLLRAQWLREVHAPKPADESRPEAKKAEAKKS